jgi:hypothetical protein
MAHDRQNRNDELVGGDAVNGVLSSNTGFLTAVRVERSARIAPVLEDLPPGPPNGGQVNAGRQLRDGARLVWNETSTVGLASNPGQRSSAPGTSR